MHRLCNIAIAGVCLLPFVCTKLCRAQDAVSSDVVFLEVPIVVQAPGFHKFIKAYSDGEEFYIDMVDLLRLLGFRVDQKEGVLSAMDMNRSITLDYDQQQATLGEEEDVVPLLGELQYSEGMYLMTVAGIKRVFDADLTFDEARLSLRLSSAASNFQTSALGPRRFLGGEAPGPLRFGFERHLLGGSIISWHATSQWYRGRQVYTDMTARYSVNTLGGVVEGTAVKSSYSSTGFVNDVNYTFVRPGNRLANRVALGNQPWSDGTYMVGMRVSNLPLVTPHIQRTTSTSGRVEPHAIVEVLVGGQITDRTQADADGRYSLRIPAYYGTTEAVVRVQPLGGAAPYERRQYVLTTPALTLHRRVYYDAVIGRESAVQLQYGLTPRVTLRTGGSTARDFITGVTASPAPNVILSTDVDWPNRFVNTTVQMWRYRLGALAAYTSDHGSQNVRMSASGQFRQWEAHVSAVARHDAESWVEKRLMPAISFHTRNGMSLRSRLNLYTVNGIHRTSWRFTWNQVRSVRGTGLHTGAFMTRDASWALGGEVLVSFSTFFVGLNAKFDSGRNTIHGQLTLQWRSPIGSIRSGVTSGGMHSYSGFGTVGINPGIRFSYATHDESGAVLRIFEDLNRNGRKDPAEPILPDVEVQVWHAPVSRRNDGTLIATFLQPNTAYQVQIIEHSIRDPWLRPAPGYSFSFMAEPGRVKELDIPLQRLPLIRGRIAPLARPPGRLQVVAMIGQEVVETSPVYRDGGFALRLQPGQYTLRVEDVVDMSILFEEPLEVQQDSRTQDVEVKLD